MASNKLRTRITYTSEAVDQMSDAEVRKAYTSIRHIAVERYKRLASKGFQNTQTYKNASAFGGFPTIGEMTEGQIRQQLLDTSLWLRSPYSKVSKMNERNRKAAESFRKMGYTGINKSNINDFLNFLNDMQEAYGDKNYGYEKIAEAYSTAQKVGIPEEELRKNFEKWMKNESAIRRSAEAGADADQIRQIFKMKQQKRSSLENKYIEGRKRSWNRKK